MLHTRISEYKRQAHAPGRVKKTSKKGASPRRVSSVRVFSLDYVLKLVAVAITAGVITAGLVWFDPKEKISRLSAKPIREVQLEGDFQYLSKSEASELIAEQIDGSFIELDIKTLKTNIERHPWIDSVTITRQWPDKLKIRIMEQHPIALWGEKSFLNRKGDIIELEKTAKINTLPKLSGSDVFAKEIMQQYLQMSKVLSQSELELKSVIMDPTRAWRIELDGEIEVKLGRKNLLQKLQLLAKVSEAQLQADMNKVDSIDMRYPGGFAVAWKETDEQYVAEM